MCNKVKKKRRASQRQFPSEEQKEAQREKMFTAITGAAQRIYDKIYLLTKSMYYLDMVAERYYSNEMIEEFNREFTTEAHQPGQNRSPSPISLTVQRIKKATFELDEECQSRALLLLKDIMENGFTDDNSTDGGLV